jgi:hypothetical protein
MSSVDPEPDPSPEEAVAVDPEQRVFQPMSLRGPAMVVLGIAVFILVAGVLASAFASGADPALSIHQITLPDGTTVHLTPATTALRSIVSAGEPPADILDPMAVPAHSTMVRTVDTDQGASQFDRTAYFETDLSSDQVVDLYHALLPRLGWKLLYSGGGLQRSGSGTGVLANKGSGDSFYWEVGETTTPTSQ